MLKNSFNCIRSNVYNSGIWSSVVFSKPKKESRYSKVASGERTIRDLVIWSLATMDDRTNVAFLTFIAISGNEYTG